jgi:hypothetical protein
MQAMLRIMDGNVKIGKSGMSLCIQKNVFWFDVTTWSQAPCPTKNSKCIPMHYAFAMKIRHTRGQLCCPKVNDALRKVAFSI